MLNKYLIMTLVVITITISANAFFPSGDDILVYNETRGKKYLPTILH